MSRYSKKHFFLLLTAILIVYAGAARLFFSQRPFMKEMEQSYSKGLALNLDKGTRQQELSSLMSRFIDDEGESRYVAGHVISRIRQKGKTLGNINDLRNEHSFLLQLDSSVLVGIANFPSLSSRAQSLLESLEYGNSPDPADLATFDMAGGAPSRKYRCMIWHKEAGKHRTRISPDDTIYLKISEHWRDYSSDGKSCVAKDSVFAYVPALGGKASFRLPKKSPDGMRRYFSVTPIQPDGLYTFGASQGTYKNKFHMFRFHRKHAALPIISTAVFKKIKEANALTVRTPEKYLGSFFAVFALWGCLWVLFFFCLAAVDRRRGTQSCGSLVAAIALLTGFGLLNLFNIPNPLAGTIWATRQFMVGFIAGLGLMLASSCVGWVRIFQKAQGRSLKEYGTFLNGRIVVIIIVAFSLLMAFFGYGPGGSKVNLNIFGLSVQGQPVIKYLTWVALAIFFANKSELIASYSRTIYKHFCVQHLRTVFFAIVLLLLLLVFQLGVLSDLGPFVVLAATAIVVYSICRKDTIHMLVGVGLYILMIVVSHKIFTGSYFPYAIFGVWLAIWLLYSLAIRRQIYESAILMSLVVLFYVYGGTFLTAMGLHEEGYRMEGRTEMCIDAFDNEATGGDQVAQGIWGMSQGGAFGDPGTGAASFIPAAHTDMVLESAVEGFGFFGGAALPMLALLVLAYAIMNAGIRHGHPFAFYFCYLSGIGLILQAMVIGLGSCGVIPLSGVPFPFLSYGSSAMIMDMAALGVVLSISSVSDTELQLFNTRQYVRMARGAMVAMTILALVILTTVFRYSISRRDTYMAKPALVCNSSGYRILEYNPRIAHVQKELHPGDIFDGKGVVLATYEAGKILNPAAVATYQRYGIYRNQLVDAASSGGCIYPFGNYTLFITGDINRHLLWGGTERNPYGILVGEQNLSRLRGYDNYPSYVTITSSKFHSRYMPTANLSSTDICVAYDYRELLPILKGKTTIDQWESTHADRDVHLTVDARLQKRLEEEAVKFVLRHIASDRKTSARTRVSIVVIDAVTGDIKASAVCPLPDGDILAAKAEQRSFVYRDDVPGFSAYADRDMGLTYFTAPGSIFKLYVAAAAARRFGTALTTGDYSQFVYNDEIVDMSLGEPTGNVSLKTAIARSSNIYFIKLLHEFNLYPELADICWNSGIKFGSDTPDVLNSMSYMRPCADYSSNILEFGRNSVAKYERYKSSGGRHRLVDSEYQVAWGQGQIAASPLSICRLVGAIANDGVMMETRYSQSDSVAVKANILDPEEAAMLRDCMKAQASGTFRGVSWIGGKTGTPNRSDKLKPSGKSNDAWYTFFVEGDNTPDGHPLAVTVRMERVNTYSELAMKFTKEEILPVLLECGYILRLN